MNNKEINSLLKQIARAKKEHNPETSLVSNCFYLKDGNILAMRNPYGDSRHPYSVDGLTLWAYASGNIVINQSNYFISPLTVEGKEPYINIYAGIKNKKGEYDYFSLLGNADNSSEDVYTVFNENYCYYIRKIRGLVLVAKMMITLDKKILISTQVLNKNKKDVNAFISFYFNPLMTHTSEESEETKWFRTVYNHKDYSTFVSVEDLSREVHLYNYLVLKNANNADAKQVTSRRMDYVGDKNRSIAFSKCLKQGFFEKDLPVATFVDMAVYGDILRKNLKKDEALQSNYQISLSFNKDEVSLLEKEEYSLETNDSYFDVRQRSNTKNLKIRFGKFHERYPLNNVLFNNFIDSVIRQVDYSAKTKNSSLMLLGIRDVYQMMEVDAPQDNIVKKQMEVNRSLITANLSTKENGLSPQFINI